MYKKLLIISICSLVVCSCAPKTHLGASVQESYYENLSAYRPTDPIADRKTKEIVDNTNLANIVPVHHINEPLNAVLDSISVLSRRIKHINGYTVQIYSGNSRETANIASGKASTILRMPDIEVSYKAPNFKVQVGNFYNNLQAHSVHAQLLRDFPNAIIVLKKIPINRD